MSRRRGAKGAVHIVTRGKMLSLRWTFQGEEYRFALGLPDTPTNRQIAQGRAGEIQTDMAFGQFDKSLAKYDPTRKELIEMTTIALFSKFTQTKRDNGTSPQRIQSAYKPLASNLERFRHEIDDETSAREFIGLLRSRQSARIANDNLSLLKGFGRWAVETSAWEQNHFQAIPPIKSAQPTQNRQPFTLAEIEKIFTVLKDDPRFSHYHDFCLTMLNLGLRPSEAIGLRWAHLDLSKQIATISESLARSGNGQTAGHSRQRKGTKTENSRVVPIPKNLRSVLGLRHTPETKPDDLVFLTPTCKIIDDHYFSQKVWRKVLAIANVGHRPPYTLRHTLISYGIEAQGWTLQQAAQIAGHKNTRMVNETYGHMINLPQMPDFEN